MTTTALGLNRVQSLLVEPCDFEGFPVGGQLSFARHMMRAFGPRLALVGWRTDDGPVGRWHMKEFTEGSFPFFALGRRRPHPGRPLVPLRISAYRDLLRHRHNLRAAGVPNLFTQSPESYLALGSLDWVSSCYLFPGVENPLERPRYFWGRPFAHLYERHLFSALRRADLLLACADLPSIDRLVQRSQGALRPGRVLQFPSRVDTTIFYPRDRDEARAQLGLPLTSKIAVSCGRLNRVKGWPLLLSAFALVAQEDSERQLVFIGDGEDKQALLASANNAGLSRRVHVTGFLRPELVATNLCAADVALVGSHVEGWSVAVLEALACGTPVVSTDVSGARDLLMPGQTGFVVQGREPPLFAHYWRTALTHRWDPDLCVAVASQYSVETLASQLGALWPPLSTTDSGRTSTAGTA